MYANNCYYEGEIYCAQLSYGPPPNNTFECYAGKYCCGAYCETYGDHTLGYATYCWDLDCSNSVISGECGQACAGKS